MYIIMGFLQLILGSYTDVNMTILMNNYRIIIIIIKEQGSPTYGLWVGSASPAFLNHLPKIIYFLKIIY